MTGPADAAVAAVRSGCEAMTPIGLAEVLDVAELQSRVDRKYLLTPAQFGQLLGDLGGALRILEIGDRRDFHYESVYFDTDDYSAYRQAATGRRRKFKVRTRTYLDSGTCMLEVKTAGGRGETLKDRMAYGPGYRKHLDPRAKDFVDDRVWLPGGASSLRPVLTTTYLRTTLVDPLAGTRMTCDARLRCTAPNGDDVAMDSHVLVESKSPDGPTAADRLLWSMGERPVQLSKYCVGLALIEPGLPANRWNRTLRRYFGWTPVPPAPAA